MRSRRGGADEDDPTSNGGYPAAGVVAPQSLIAAGRRAFRRSFGKTEANAKLERAMRAMRNDIWTELQHRRVAKRVLACPA